MWQRGEQQLWIPPEDSAGGQQPHRGFLSPPVRDAANGMDLVFAQNRVKSETRVVEQGEES